MKTSRNGTGHIAPSLVSAYRFMVVNAGYCVGFRAQGALQLARAEQWAQSSDDLRYRWVEDLNADLSWCDPSSVTEVLGCILERKCPTCGQWECVASLWGICDPDRSYGRVVEAELALEVLN